VAAGTNQDVRWLRVSIPLALTTLALASAPPAAAGDAAHDAAVGPAPTRAIAMQGPSLAHLEVSLDSLAVALHRRAVDFVERERDRASSPWVGARIADRVLPMVRPGDVEPTYYEVRVEGGDGTPLGYFVLATAEHDHSVPVAVDEGPSRSRQLEDSLPAGAVVGRVNFFNAVSQVAEGADGGWLAGLGGFPVKVEALGTTQAELGSWGSWDELRSGYRENYRQPHEIMRRNAADDWEDLRRGKELAEGLQPGWFREIPILDRGGATFRVEGSGRDLVRVERYERVLEGDEVISVFVDPFELQGVHPLDVHLDYADGTTEVTHLAITRRVPGVDHAANLNLGGLLAAPAGSGTSSGSNVECSKVVVRSSWDTYLFARDGGGSTLEAKGGWIGGWEIFRLDLFKKDVVALRATNGKYVRAAYDGGSEIRVDGDSINGFTRFRRENLGNGAVELRTFYKHLPLRAHSNGGVDAGPDGDERKRNRLFVEYCSPNRITAHWAGASDPISAMKKVRKYDQLDGKQGPNKAPCASGCGATVWAMVFGWADHMAANNHAEWRDYGRLYTRDGDPTKGDVGAPEFMWTDMPNNVVSSRDSSKLEAGVGNIVEEIRSYMNDWGAAGCTMTGSRFTAPQIMAQSRQYLTRRGIDMGLNADYDGLAIMTAAGKANVLSQIRDHDRVTAIGIDWFGHYPLAYGYEHARFAAWDAGTGSWAAITDHHRFVVNMGWGKYGSANVPYDSWFAGYVSPRVSDKSDGSKSGTGGKAGATSKSGPRKRAGKGRSSRRSGGIRLPPAPNRVLPPPT
jgi:hypothetical protein